MLPSASGGVSAHAPCSQPSRLEPRAARKMGPPSSSERSTALSIVTLFRQHARDVKRRRGSRNGGDEPRDVGAPTRGHTHGQADPRAMTSLLDAVEARDVVARATDSAEAPAVSACHVRDRAGPRRRRLRPIGAGERGRQECSICPPYLAVAERVTTSQRGSRWMREGPAGSPRSSPACSPTRIRTSAGDLHLAEFESGGLSRRTRRKC